MLRSIFTHTIAVASLLALTACGSGLDESPGPTPTVTVQPTPTSAPSPVPTPQPTATVVSSPVPTTVPLQPTGPKRVAFTSDQRDRAKIHVSDFGGEGTELTKGQGFDRRSTWSPDGTRIAFDSDRDGNLDIYVVDGDGNNLTQLTNDPSNDYSPSWSADGSRLAFISNRSGVSHLWVMNTDGSDKKDLTPDMTKASRVSESPGWSPDGTKIAFVARALWVMNSDGTNLKRVTLPADYVTQPVWSPSGAMIAVNSWKDQTRGWNSSIYLVSPLGVGIRRVTAERQITEEIRDEPLGWLVDDQEIIFRRAYFGDEEKEELWSVDIKSGEEEFIAPLPSSDAALSWIRR